MIKKWGLFFYLAIMQAMLSSTAYSALPDWVTDRGDGWGPTQAPNVGGVANTRHNLSMDYVRYNYWMDGPFLFDPNPGRNNYGEVCVYCHTPHAATEIDGTPLWNRTTPDAGTFTLYDKPTSHNRTVTNPGPNSLTCLSCHDGTIAVDSIINMPSAGRYLASQANSVNTTFLNEWNNIWHGTLSDCIDCHENNTDSYLPSFEGYVIGKDLRNDHPIGVSYPDTADSALDFIPPNAEKPGKMQFFDLNGNQRADNNEIRLYNSGQGYEVECATCHDPHGVMNPRTSTMVYAFLRQDNYESKVCLSCHIK